MLASQLQQVLHLDNEINQRHRELADLYQKRAEIVAPDTNTLSVAEPAAHTQTQETANEYQKLAEAWGFYNIAVPSQKTLQKRLNKAEAIRDNIYSSLPNLRGLLSIVLVPPQKIIGFPVKSSLREQQDFIVAADYLNPGLKLEATNQAWKVLLVFNADEGMYLGDPQTVLSEKNYMIGDYDGRALGMQEYAAFSLQERHMFDSHTWTMLLKGKRKGQVVPIASRTHGRFSFEFDESNSDFGDDRFRPAIEVKA